MPVLWAVARRAALGLLAVIGTMLILSAEVVSALTGTPHALWLVWFGVTLVIGAGVIAATFALIRRTPKA